MAKIYISLGSSIKRKYHVQQGILALANAFSMPVTALSLSSLFESEAVGFEGKTFYNMVVGLNCEQSVEEVASILREIEFSYGRPAQAKKCSPRTLDLDLLLYDDLIINEPAQLPRDEISKNAFVLWPLSEVAPELTHPILNVSYATLWQNYNKQSQKLNIIPNCW